MMMAKRTIMSCKTAGQSLRMDRGKRQQQPVAVAVVDDVVEQLGGQVPCLAPTTTSKEDVEAVATEETNTTKEPSTRDEEITTKSNKKEELNHAIASSGPQTALPRPEEEKENQTKVK